MGTRACGATRACLRRVPSCRRTEFHRRRYPAVAVRSRTTPCSRLPVPISRTILHIELRSQQIWLIARQHGRMSSNTCGRAICFLLGSHFLRTGRSIAIPDPLRPHQPYRLVESGEACKHCATAAADIRDRATGRAVHRRLRRLNDDGEQTNVVIKLSTRDIQPFKAGEEIPAGVVAGARTATRNCVLCRLVQRRNISERVLGSFSS